jgi:endonuclease/exonuclease/phosphatase family metal-dependent hydrolase
MNGLRRSVGVVAGLVLVAATLTTSPAVGTRQSLRVIQMNLCDSGIAGCYTGRAVTEAAAVIRAEAPDVVTLNEVCENDVETLGQTMADLHGGEAIWAFQPADDRRTASAVLCLNGERFGIGVLVRVPDPHRRHATYGGIYPPQDAGDPEERAWLCVRAWDTLYACTTHLANTSGVVALAQCDYLFTTAIPAMFAKGGPAPVLLGADLNLRHGGSPDVRACVPRSHLRIDDGDAQHIAATPGFTLRSRTLIDMRQTTDHQGLLAELTIAAAGRCPLWEADHDTSTLCAFSNVDDPAMTGRGRPLFRLRLS